MRISVLAAVLAVAAAPVLAQDFSEGSEAKEWGLFGEIKARFTATPVDVVCALTGDCPEDCGGGLRQMALLREADGRLILAMKNRQPIFSGAAFDLAPFCGQTVEVDGTLVGDADITPGAAAQMYLVQRILPEGSEEWVATSRWSKAWAERNPGAAGEGPWFRRDPGVKAEIDANGYLGLGAEADVTYAEENF